MLINVDALQNNDENSCWDNEWIVIFISCTILHKLHGAAAQSQK